MLLEKMRNRHNLIKQLISHLLAGVPVYFRGIYFPNLSFPPPPFRGGIFFPQIEKGYRGFPKAHFFPPRYFFLNKFFPKPNFFLNLSFPNPSPLLFPPPLFPTSFNPLFLLLLFLFFSPFFFFFFFFFLFFSLFPFPFLLFSFTPFL